MSKLNVDLDALIGKRTLVLSASMPRSASTWMYNVVRLLLEQKYPRNVSAGWIEDFKELERKEIILLKIHDYDHTLAKRADYVFYSFRDIRAVFASAIRKFGSKQGMYFPINEIKNDKGWKKHADYIMKYESFLGKETQEIQRIASVLNIKNINAAAINETIDYLKNNVKLSTKQHDSVSLFHKDHSTTIDGRNSGIEQIHGELIHQMEKEFETWFIENGYKLTSPR